MYTRTIPDVDYRLDARQPDILDSSSNQQSNGPHEAGSGFVQTVLSFSHWRLDSQTGLGSLAPVTKLSEVPRGSTLPPSDRTQQLTELIQGQTDYPTCWYWGKLDRGVTDTRSASRPEATFLNTYLEKVKNYSIHYLRILI